VKPNRSSREEYVRKVLDAYRQTPGTTEALVAKTGYWLLNCMTEPSP